MRHPTMPAFLIVSITIVACEPSSPSAGGPRDSAASARPERSAVTRDAGRATNSAVADTPSTTMSTGCRHTGLWDLCTFEKRLKQAGFVTKLIETGKPRRAGFTPLPTVYTVGRARLEVFLYRDAAAMTSDLAALDTLTVAPRGANASWEGTPMLIRSGNLAAVFLPQNPRQAERLALAITAGAPQPGSPR